MNRPTAEIERLKQCVWHDACDRTDCVYFSNVEDLRKVILYIQELEKANTYSYLEGKDGT